MSVIRPENPDKDFSLEHYNEILVRLIETHRPLSFRDANILGRDILKIARFVIMRHDVEFSLSGAVRLAKADYQNGIKSTFFLLQTSDYNPFEEDGAAKVRQLLDLGHDIGLHYDAAFFERLGVDSKSVVQQQIDLFETFFNTKIYAMSSHMPMRSGKTFSVPGVVDTYDPLYIRDIKYLSDSTQTWREGVVTSVLDSHPKIQLLTHDYYWHPKAHNWDTLLLLEAQEKFQYMWTRALLNIDTYREGLRLREHKDKKFHEHFIQREAL